MGVCSYSIYLVHFAVIDVARLVLKELGVSRMEAGIVMLMLIYIPVIALWYCIATWTHRMIEVPGIELGRRVCLRILSKSGAITASPEGA